MNSLDDPKVRTVLERLHRAARGDWWFFAKNLPMMLRMVFGSEAKPAAEQAQRLKDVYIPISPEQGRFH
jgi:hypothetical protein